jgi:hypothetical protein
MNRDCIPARDQEVIWRILEDELVLVRPASGEIRVLNAVGATVWQFIDGKRSVADLAAEICDAYAVASDRAQTDVAAFVKELAAEGWLTLESDP